MVEKTTKEKPENRLKAIDLAITQIERQHGKGSIMRLGSSQHLHVNVITTGSLSLDIALGVGGIPRGLITEIYGNEGSGKTTLAYHMIAEAQKAGGTAAYIDAEQRMDPDLRVRGWRRSGPVADLAAANGRTGARHCRYPRPKRRA